MFTSLTKKGGGRLPNVQYPDYSEFETSERISVRFPRADEEVPGESTDGARSGYD